MKYEVLWNRCYADEHISGDDYDENRTAHDWSIDDMWEYAQEENSMYSPEWLYDGDDFDAAGVNYREARDDCKTYIGSRVDGALLIYDVVVFKCDDRIIAWHIKPLKKEVK